ncbi:DUF4469 domain-containing protein [Candidatus Electrothrix gigas]
MATVQYRIERNPLTKPATYRLRFLSKGTGGYEEVARRVALKNPGASAEQIKNHVKSAFDEIAEMLTEGLQVTLRDTLTIRPAFHASLNSPDDPLPPMDELFRLSITATRPYVRAVRENVTLERVGSEEKAPSLLSASDATLELNNVLNPVGVLRLTGNHLAFDRNDPDCQCVIAGTESGSTKQSQFAGISNSEILVVPHIPAQTNPWNNEYTVSVTTRYTAHGSLRTGTYGRKLRSPLSVSGFGQPELPPIGILTDNAAAPYVNITGGTVAAPEQLRIQADYNLQADQLSFSLLDLHNNGASGVMVPVTANGDYTLNGFTGSAVSSLNITVNDYESLKAMIRNDYDGRLVDILDVLDVPV